MDLCEKCIRLKKFEIGKCENCGKIMVFSHIEGHSIMCTCKNCGYTVIGASFYSPCELDNKVYHIKILGKNITNTQIIELSKIMNFKVLSIKKSIDLECNLEKPFYLKEIMKIIQYLNKQGLIYNIFPNVQYSKYFSCLLKEIG